MTVQQRPPDETSPVASPIPPGRGRWNWLAVARIVWMVLTLVLLAIFVANIPAYYQSLNTFCTQASLFNCPSGQLSLGNVQALAQLHLPVTAVAGLLATLTLAVSVLYWVVGLLIFWRKSGEWMGLFFSMVCVVMGAINVFGFPVAQTPQLIQLLTNSTGLVLSPVLIVFFLTFPTGRFAPRWTWAVFILAALLWLPFLPGALSLLLFPPLSIGVQVYRYARIYDAVQRQQAKWLVFGFSAGLAYLAIYNILGTLVPELSAPDSLYQLINALTWPMLWTILLLSVSIPILRYRLWDIDVIINRTLVYGSLTVLLVGLYVGLILALQALVRAVTGSLSQSPLVIVGSTLVIAALFQPLRRRLQTSIDRRFYRRKYDATKVLAAFSASLRNEVDLDQLREQLVAVVQESMQPAHVSLWLRPPAQDGTQRALWSATPPDSSEGR